MAGVAVINAVVFGVHGSLMKKMSDPESLSSQGLAGAGAGLAQAFVASPMELAKARLQIQSSDAASVLTRYTSPVNCFKTIVRREGIKGVFRGQVITVMREVPGFATYFTSYSYLVKKLSDEDDGPSSAAILLAGGLAGIASCSLTHPLDVIKSRLQTDGRNGFNKYNGISHCLKVGLSTEGPSFLTRGLLSTVIRAFPSTAVTFSIVNVVMNVAEASDDFGDSGPWQEVLLRGEALVSAASGPVTSWEMVMAQSSSSSGFTAAEP